MAGGQSITIKIADRTYPLKVTGPEQERMMRLAAESVNSKLATYNARYPNAALVDKLAFVTINETVINLSSQKSSASVKAEAESLEKELETYLAKIESR